MLRSSEVPEFRCSAVCKHAAFGMAAPESQNDDRKRAAVRVATILRSTMGVDDEANLKQDMYTIMQEKFATIEAKTDFHNRINGLKVKLVGLGITAEVLEEPIQVIAVVIVIVAQLLL